ncbi:Sulfite reductase [NADPH] subunit beta, partial [Coemansia brasiliensis]
MSSSLRKETLSTPSTAAAVAYSTAISLGAPIAIVDDATTATTADLIRDSTHLLKLQKAVEIASLSDSHKLINIIVPASELIKLIPTLRDLAQNKRAAVLHVPISSASDVSDILSVRDSGCSLLRSSSAQQAVDFALAAALSAQKLGTPFIHCFPESTGSQNIQAYKSLTDNAEIASFVDSKQESEDSSSPVEATFSVVSQALKLFDTRYSPISYEGAANASLVYVTFGTEIAAEALGEAGAVQISLLRPLNMQAVVEKLPQSALRVVALEQVVRQPTPWGPMLFDLAAVLHSQEWEAQTERKRPIILDAVSAAPAAAFSTQQLAQVTKHATGLDSPAHFNPAQLAGIAEDGAQTQSPADLSGLSLEEKRQRVESIPYGQLLRNMFKDRLNVANAAESQTIWGDAGRTESNPEFGFGQLATYERERAQLAQAVGEVLRDVNVPLSKALHSALSLWLGGRDNAAVATAEQASEISSLLEAEAGAHPALETVQRLRGRFELRSNWLVGADEWAYDLGNSGVHHVIASGLNINMLVLDTAQYPFAAENKHGARKKDVGLYAMNYGTTYVASVAVYASYTQVLQAFAEADAFPGPAVVVAYLPHSDGVFSSNYSPIDVLQQSKLAVDSGAWPLYRWDPLTRDSEKRFQLDSEKLRRSVQDFLKRENVLAAVGATEAQLSGGLGVSEERHTGARLARKARGDVDAL